MLEEVEEKKSNPINIINVSEGKTINKLNISRDKYYPKKENINQHQISGQGPLINNNSQNMNMEKNFGSDNKDYRTNLSTNPNFSYNQQPYNTNSNHLRSNNN